MSGAARRRLKTVIGICKKLVKKSAILAGTGSNQPVSAKIALLF